MPIYEYFCTKCGHTLEALQSMSESPLKQCPSCGKETLQKKISAAGFQLKGSGWYATDFKDKKPTPKEDNTMPTEKPTESSKPVEEKKGHKDPPKDRNE